MPNYVSHYTGEQVDSSIGKAMPLDTFAHYEDKAIGGKTYHIMWKVKPTSSNTVTGIAIDPATGKQINVVSINNVLAVYQIITTEDITNKEVFSGMDVTNGTLSFSTDEVLKRNN